MKYITVGYSKIFVCRFAPKAYFCHFNSLLTQGAIS